MLEGKIKSLCPVFAPRRLWCEALSWEKEGHTDAEKQKGQVAKTAGRGGTQTHSAFSQLTVSTLPITTLHNSKQSPPTFLAALVPETCFLSYTRFYQNTSINSIYSNTDFYW